MKCTHFLVLVCAFAFFIRALVFMFYLGKDENYWQVDSPAYHDVAKNITEGKGITTAEGMPLFRRLPGYAVFLSLYYRFVEVDTKNVLWLQIVLSSFIPLLIYFLFLVFFPGATAHACCAALYSATHLGLVLYSGFYMTETVFIFLFLLFSIVFFSAVLPRSRLNSARPDSSTGSELKAAHPELVEGYERSEGRAQVAISGLLLGVASLVRPVGHYFILLACLLLMFSHGSWVIRGKKIGAFFGGWLLVISPWLIRNFVLTGQFFFHTLPGGHFLYLSAARVAMEVKDVSYWEARDMLCQEFQQLVKKEENESKRPLTEIEQCNVGERLARSYFLSYPFCAIKYWLTDMVRTSFSLYSAELVYLASGRKVIDYFKKGRGLWAMVKRYLAAEVEHNWLRFIIYLEIFFFLFILVGFFAGLYQYFSVGIWMVPVMAFFIGIALAGGYARMRLPIEPFLIIFAWRYWGDVFFEANQAMLKLKLVDGDG